MAEAIMTGHEILKMFEPNAEVTHMRVDVIDADTTYLGWTSHSLPDTSDAEWFVIKKLTATGLTTYAKVTGSKGQDQTWDGRAAFTYDT